jgi:hypothetical protein
MAGKTARGNEKRKAGYKSHPSRLAVNVLRRRKSHITALRKKLRKFERYVQAGKMTQAAFEAATERIEKEISYTQGDLPRAAPNYRKGMRSKRPTETTEE